MRSTIVIANELNELGNILTEKTDQLIKDSALKKQLHDIASNISVIGIFNGLETSKKMITETLSNTKNLISALKENSTIQSSIEINKLLNAINISSIEYEESLRAEEKGESPEALIDKINTINQRLKAFKYTNNPSVGIFSAPAETSVQTKTDVVSDSKISPEVKTKHINGVSSQVIPSGTPTKKSS